MARDSDSDQEEADAAHAPRECMACRGTGHVISNLGGTPSTVECPWCGGTGQRQVGRDAQERWRAQQGSSEGDAEPAAQPADAPPDGAA